MKLAHLTMMIKVQDVKWAKISHIKKCFSSLALSRCVRQLKLFSNAHKIIYADSLFATQQQSLKKKSEKMI